ncbi:MAG: exodeoxyribonuclease VII small subunit [Myxococcota bacterium]|nr:exodeoxyribonuclease VII small subunit [Deltaproteobacteria bacterium]MCP4240413.1 exodeoxyribonuclease VII small subunit [bacterium]MDP6074777.1 exodeoxyribonuclease VII small subunit [Myxococcota bacterium]MDP6243932.1 exodeoxyribonuclease VII small subunit [Myxococcota bacterium]MDP7076312.1 exodeoxyribonuclease VII small subunit [Myxococcota bacterium]
MGRAKRKLASEAEDGAEAAEETSFEQALEALEAIVDRLEQGDLPLEDALAAFEKGVALTRRCAGELDTAERRIEELVRDGEKWLVRPFEGTDDAQEAEE